MATKKSIPGPGSANRIQSTALPADLADSSLSFSPVGPSATDPGVHALWTLMHRMSAISNDSVGRFGDEVDGRNYAAAKEAVRSSLLSAAHHDGYVCALADLLMMVADGVTPGREWDPIGCHRLVAQLETTGASTAKVLARVAKGGAA